MNISVQIPTHIQLDKIEFQELSEMIFSLTGIKMTDVKKGLVENRLQKRLKSLKLDTFSDYVQLVLDENSLERQYMIDEITTNKTFFYREIEHFRFFKEVILPDFAERPSNEINIWCSACSSGEETYTLSIEIDRFLKKTASYFNYEILGTDISSKMIRESERGIYTSHTISEVPKEILSQYFLQSVNRKLKLVKIGPEARRNVRFQYLNLMDDWYDVPMNDIIFCRNVLIYFDRDTQNEVITKSFNRLKENGYLILGHSESIMGLDLPLRKVGPSIFQKQS